MSKKIEKLEIKFFKLERSKEREKKKRKYL